MWEKEGKNGTDRGRKKGKRDHLLELTGNKRRKAKKRPPTRAVRDGGETRRREREDGGGEGGHRRGRGSGPPVAGDVHDVQLLQIAKFLRQEHHAVVAQRQHRHLRTLPDLRRGGGDGRRDNGNGDNGRRDNGRMLSIILKLYYDLD